MFRNYYIVGFYVFLFSFFFFFYVKQNDNIYNCNILYYTAIDINVTTYYNTVHNNRLI